MDAATQRAVQVARLALLATTAGGAATRPPLPAAPRPPPPPASGGTSAVGRVNGPQRRRRGGALAATRDGDPSVPYAPWAKAASRRRSEGGAGAVGSGGSPAASSLFAESAELSEEGEDLAADRANSAPRWFANAGKAHTYDVLRIDARGNTAREELKRRELLRETGLPARDLRRIDPALSLTTSAPTLLVSDTVLLINLGQVRVIVTRDHALLFEPTTRVATNFMAGLLARLQHEEAPPHGRRGEAESDGHDGDGHPSFHAPLAPFELEVVEAALLEVTGQLDGSLLDATGRVSKLNRLLPQRLAVTADVLEELRLTKQALVELDSRAGAIRQLLLEVLDDDEDVAGMSLSRKGLGTTPADVEEAEDEVENLLEYYLQRCETCHGEAERLLQNTRDLEESIMVSLSARRFEVNKLELMLSIATFATAVGALIAGIFGMNLRNRFEMSTGAFYSTAAGIVLGVVVLCGLIYRYTRRKRIL